MAAETRAVQRSDQLFDAGCRLFSERGYHDVDVSDIAGHVGVSNGTFYNYYANRRALLDAIMRRSLNGYTAAIGRIDASAVGTREEYIASFEQMIRRVLARAVENPQLSSFLALTAPGVDRDAYSAAVQAFSVCGALFTEFFGYGKRRGWVREDISLKVAGRATVSCLIMAVSPLLLGDRDDLDIDVVAQVVTTYLLGGMRSA